MLLYHYDIIMAYTKTIFHDNVVIYWSTSFQNAFRKKSSSAL